MGVLVLKTQSDRHWQVMETRLEEIKSELKGIRYERVPLGGEGVPGLAWDGYSGAFEGMQGRGKVVDLGRAAAAASKAGAEVRRGETERLVGILAAELAELRRGARSLDGTPPIDWSLGTGQPLPSLMNTSALVGVLNLQGLAEIEAGRVDAGCGMILDGLQLGEDMMNAPRGITQMIGVSILSSRSLRDLLEAEGLGALPAEGLLQLESGLGVLLERFDGEPEYRGQLVLFGNDLIARLGESGGFFRMPSFEQGPRMALAPRLVTASGFLAMADGYEAVMGLRGEALLEKAREVSDPEDLFTRGLALTVSMEGSHRHARVHLELLRRALRLELGLAELAFVDPHGRTLTESHDAEHLNFAVEGGSAWMPIELRFRR